MYLLNIKCEHDDFLTYHCLYYWTICLNKKEHFSYVTKEKEKKTYEIMNQTPSNLQYS